MTALHLRIADFKFTHNFVTCNRFTRYRTHFLDRHSEEILHFLCVGQRKNCYIQRDGKFITYTRNGEQKATIGIVNLTPKILPGHNGVVPIRITGQTMKEHIASFITDEDSTKGRDPNINIINGIDNIEWKTSVNILVSNYTNKHIKFN